MDILDHNRKAWDHEVDSGNVWSRPVDPETVAKARAGEWSIVLTPIKPVPRDWFPEELNGRDILCLASGGGQQGPVLAAAGGNVTVFDNSPKQLAQDRMVADREGLEIRTEQGDMRDLSRFRDGCFDLIVHPWSNSFVDGVIGVWAECYRVLRPGGILMAGFSNSFEYVFDYKSLEDGRLVVRHRIPYSDVRDLGPDEFKELITDRNEPVCFGHSLEDQIGGQLGAGFVLTGFYGDKGGTALDAHIDTSCATRAVKPGR